MPTKFFAHIRARSIRVHQFIFSLILIGQFVFAFSAGIAQESVELSQRIASAIKPISEQLKRVEEKLNSGELDDATLTKLRVELEKTNINILNRVTEFQPEIISLYVLFDRLPPPPARDRKSVV